MICLFKEGKYPFSMVNRGIYVRIDNLENEEWLESRNKMSFAIRSMKEFELRSIGKG